LLPIALALFERRGTPIELLNNLPDELPVEVLGFAYEVGIAELTTAANDFLRPLALSLAADALSITLEVSLFVLILYGRSRPSASALDPEVVHSATTTERAVNAPSLVRVPGASRSGFRSVGASTRSGR
jgi:hypothetical protein